MAELLDDIEAVIQGVFALPPPAPPAEPLTAQDGIRVVGMVKAEALEVVRGLSRSNFYKSITTQKDHRVWQDVYHGEWRGKPL